MPAAPQPALSLLDSGQSRFCQEASLREARGKDCDTGTGILPPAKGGLHAHLPAHGVRFTRAHGDAGVCKCTRMCTLAHTRMHTYVYTQN